MARTPTIFAAALILVQLVNARFALHISSKVNGDFMEAGNDLTIPHSIELPSAKEDLVQFLDTTEKLPTCYRVASAALANACSGSDGSLFSISQQERNLFGTRGAICELLEAGLPIPHACSSFVPTVKSTIKQTFEQYLRQKDMKMPIIQYPRYNQATVKDLDRCMSKISGNMHFWTSYSNSMQNAYEICRAMRAEVESDETRMLWLFLKNTTVHTSDTILENLERLKEWSEASQSLGQKLAASQADVTELQRNVKSSTEEIMFRLSAHLSSFFQQFSELSKVTQQATTDLDLHNSRVTDAFARGQLYTENLEATIRDADRSIAMLRDVVQITSHEIVQDLTAVRAEANDTMEALAALNQNIDKIVAVSEYFTDFGTSWINQSRTFGFILLVEGALVGMMYICLITLAPLQRYASVPAAITLGSVLCYLYYKIDLPHHATELSQLAVALIVGE